MNIFERIDALILSFFTKISHRFQRLTGRTNFFLAKITIGLLGLSNIFFILNSFIPILNPPKTNLLIGVVIGGFWIYVISKDWNKLKSAEDRSLSEEQAKTRFILGGR